MRNPLGLRGFGLRDLQLSEGDATSNPCLALGFDALDGRRPRIFRKKGWLKSLRKTFRTRDAPVTPWPYRKSVAPTSAGGEAEEEQQDRRQHE